jgi:fibronectin-binding autotransporter adhesin
MGLALYSTRRLSVAVLTAAGWLAAVAMAQGQVTWDSSFSTTGPQDGSGTWSTSASGTNWWDGTTNVVWPNISSSTAVFGAGGTAGTVTVSGSVTAGGITFAPIASWNSTRYTITGGTIGLGSNATILVTGSSGSQFDGPTFSSNLVASNLTISSTGPYASNGSVGFALAGTNLLTGTLSLIGSIYFNASSGAALGSATVNIGSGITLDLARGGGAVTLANDLIIAGVGVGGRGAIRIINDASAAGDVYNGTVTLAADASVNGNSGHNATFTKGFAQTAGGAKNLTINNGGGTVFLRGKSTYTGTTSLTGGLVLDAGTDSLSSQTVISISGSGSRLVLGGTANGAISQTVSGLISSEPFAAVAGGHASTSTLVASIPFGTNTFAGILGGTAANANNLALRKSGAGTLTLTGSLNTYAGNTTISGGTLALGANATMVNSLVITVGDAGSSATALDLTAKTGTFSFGSNQTVGGIGTINVGAGKTVSAAGIWAPGNSIGSNAVTGNLALSGTAQFELGTPGSGTSSPGSSDFTAVSGTLTLGGNLALLDNSGSNSQGSYGAGSYRLFTATAVSGSFASVTSPAGATTTRVGMVYTAGTASGQGVFANVYNLASAAGTQTVSLGNTRVGTALTGSISLSNVAPSNATYSEALSTGGFSNTSGGFTASGSASNIAGGGSGSGNLLVGLGTSLTAGAQLGTTTLALFSNAVNSSGLAQQAISSQTITITGSTYDFAQAKFTGTTLDFGVVHVGASVAGQNVAFGNQTVTNASFQDSLNVSATTGNARVTATGFTGLAASAGGGTTNNVAVSVSTATAGSLASTLALTLTSNANGVAGLSNGTAVTVGGGSITTTGGVFSGTASWNVDGGGSWGSGASANWTSAESVSAAPGTFAGYTTTDSATFGTALTGGTASILLNGATPNLASIVFANTAGRYVLDQGSGGSLTLAATSGKPTVSVASGALNEIKAAILGTAGLQKTGLGTLVLSGSNTYSGGTDITAGTLAVNGSLGGAVNVASGGVLGGSGALSGLVTVAAGGSLAPGNSPGTLTLNSGLALDGSSILNFELNATDATVGGGINDLINVTSNFTLAGILNVSGIGDFSTAANNTTWRLFNYSGGTFTNNTLTLGTMPSVGATGKYFRIDTTMPNQVNLVIVPEPGALALAGIGIGIAGWLARRRN